jgi:hypothetical protein
MVSIQNQQSYNFAAQANALVYMALGVFLVIACSMIMMSFRPEKKFLQMLSRFFRAGEYLIPRLAGDRAHRPGVVERWKSAYYHRELATLPAKLGAWGKFVDHKKFPGGSPEQVQQLVTSVQSLGYRMDELTDAGRSPQAELLVREMLGDVRSWREAIQHTFQRWAETPEYQPAGDVQQQLDAGLERLEAKIARTLEQTDPSELKATDYENFYRLLGSYRGLSREAVAYVGVARSIDLTTWREESF